MDDASLPSSPKIEPGVLLEETWFFGNLLNRKSRMLRCYSDPCPSSKNFLGGKSMEQTFSSLEKLPDGKRLNLDSRSSNPRLERACKSNNLERTPSLPVFVDYKEDEINDEESEFSMGKLIRQASINHHRSSNLQRTPSLPAFEDKEEVNDEENEFSMGKLIKVSCQKKILPPKTSQQSNLQRAPSLPAFVDRKEESHDEESDFSMGKLIRQASLNHARVLPPKYTSKGLTKCPSINSTPRRKQVQESKITRNSSAGLEVEDLQGFKKLDINCENKDSIPKLKKKKKKPIGLSELEKMRRPYVSEAWLAPAPDLVVKNSSEDMKEHIKFWARAVASNVR